MVPGSMSGPWLTLLLTLLTLLLVPASGPPQLVIAAACPC
jgi:hypothetical protein